MTLLVPGIARRSNAHFLVVPCCFLLTNGEEMTFDVHDPFAQYAKYFAEQAKKEGYVVESKIIDLGVGGQLMVFVGRRSSQ